MAEKQRCQEGHRLCANNCGFFGSPATLNLCSNCYQDHRLSEEQASSAKIAVENSLLAASSSANSVVAEKAGDVKDPPALVAEQRRPVATGPGRCAACRKRVGLTGFACRCGASCCGTHRYPEQHGCTFDFKAAGREAIARDNPVVKADKVYKI